MIQGNTRVVPTSTGVVVIKPERGIVVKFVHQEFDDRWGLFNREYAFSERVSGTRGMVSVISALYGVMMFEYAGEPLTIENAPTDMEEQFENMLYELEELAIRHNDINPGNILVKDGKLTLIDFGWATNVGSEMPGHWPEVLGGEFRGDNGFNDRESVQKVIKFIRGEGVRINHNIEKRSVDLKEFYPSEASKKLDEIIARLSKADNRKNTVSICMIVRNEEKNLEELLPQLVWADEIVIVDTGSRDLHFIRKHFTETAKDFLKNFIPDFKGKLVFDLFDWVDDFSKARNHAKSLCTSDLVLWLDADDRLPESTQKTLRKELDEGRESTRKTVHYLNVIMTKDGGKPSGASVSQPRLFPNIPEIYWEGRVHETVGKSIQNMPRAVTDIEIHHTGYEDMKLLESKVDRNLRLLKKSDKSPQVYMDLGNVYQAKAEFLPGDEGINYHKRALENFNKALVYPGEKNENYDSHIKYQMGVTASCMGDPDTALAYFIESSKPDAIYGQADCLVKLGREREGLLKYMEYLYTEQDANFMGSDRYNLRNNAYKQLLAIIGDNYRREYKIMELVDGNA